MIQNNVTLNHNLIRFIELFIGYEVEELERIFIHSLKATIMKFNLFQDNHLIIFLMEKRNVV